MKRKKSLLLLIFILISVITFSSTEAYFNSKFQLGDLINGNDTEKLSIKNGQVNLEFSDMPTNWNVDGSNINSVNDVVTVDSRKNNSINAKYQYVYINTEKTTLTTNVNLSVLYGLTSNIPSNIESESSYINPAEPFEVIVGDMDNNNLTSTDDKGKTYYQGFETKTSPYSGTKYPHTSSTDIYPYDDNELISGRYTFAGNITGLNKIDAAGTDRRMSATGFYNTIMEISGATNSKDAYYNLINSGKATYAPYNSTKYRLLKLSRDYTNSENTLYAGHQLWCDYYTDRPMVGGKHGGPEGTSDNTIRDYNINGVNWKYIQPVEPITFKYDEVDINEDIVSAQIYLYIDDIQSGLALDTNSFEFSAVSQNKYAVTLSAKDENGNWKDYPVPEWDSTVNEIVLDGPSGYSMSFNFPSRLLNVIKIASGLKNGLKLKIDDTSFGTTGDSYCIDFAKLTVNKAPEDMTSTEGVTITGKVTAADNTPIYQATLIGADGRRTTTNKDGSYTLITSPGVISITASMSGYSSETKTFNTAQSAGSQIQYDFSLNSSYINTDDKEKMKVELKVEEYLSDTNSWQEIELTNPSQENYNSLKISGTTVQAVTRTVQLSQNKNYRISYNVTINSQNSIYADASEDFYTQFYSKLIARSTQENNPGWSEDGMDIQDYIENYYNPTNSNSQNNNKIYKGTIENSLDIPSSGVTILMRESDTKKVNASVEVKKGSNSFEIPAILDSSKKYEFVIKSQFHKENIESIDVNRTEGYILKLGDKRTIEVCIEQAKNTMGNNITFDNFTLYKENLSQISGDTNGTSHYNSNYDIVRKANISSNSILEDNWYKWILNDTNGLSANSNENKISIQVRNSSNESDTNYTYDTKPMYWFETNKIFICTE